MGGKPSKIQRKVFTFFEVLHRKPILDNPVGFTKKDVEMAHPDADKGKVKDFSHLSLEIKGEPIWWVLALSVRVPSKATQQSSYETSDKTLRAEGNLRLLHLRFKERGSAEYVLALDAKDKAIQCYRYFDIFRISTTERTLRHLALTSCQPDYSLLVADCASFARDFTTNLLAHLKDLNVINEKEFSEYEKRLVGYIHIEDGWIGESEDLSRKELPKSQEMVDLS
ncbi:unnamed protein product [Clonostachys chloroleuca]|uniref:Uncharacterized protein n=1 Tax=Clonostachys chloroleuca TaxID=1926264 RepID=A0AA35VDM8_9HYPO|nr:unnamed protein product [Clonostachys chloroleuca]